MKMTRMEINQETRINSQSMRMCSSKKKGGKPDGQTNPQSVKPLSVKLGTELNTLSTHAKFQTAIDSIVIKEL